MVEANKVWQCSLCGEIYKNKIDADCCCVDNPKL